MNLQKREFKEDYDKAAFYSIMGEFFAEKKYRDEDALSGKYRGKGMVPVFRKR